jgi:hypothetical protein
MDDGVEDSSTVSLIRLEKETLEPECFGFGHAKGPWARWDISTDSEKDCAGCKKNQLLFC